MDLSRSLMVYFLILCFIEKMTSIEIVTLKTKGTQQYKTLIKDKTQRSQKEIKDTNMRKDIKSFIDKYKNVKSVIPKVEVIDAAINGTGSEGMEIPEINSTDPCQTNLCHHQAICISIGKMGSEI